MKQILMFELPNCNNNFYSIIRIDKNNCALKKDSTVTIKCFIFGTISNFFTINNFFNYFTRHYTSKNDTKISMMYF